MPRIRAALATLAGSILLGPPKTVPRKSRTEVPPHFAGWKNAMRFAGGATSAEHGARDRRTNFRSIGFNTCSLPRVSNARSMATLAPSAASIACDGSCNPNFTTTTCHFLYHGLTLALTCNAGALSPRFRVPIFGSEFMRDREGSPPRCALLVRQGRPLSCAAFGLHFLGAVA